MFGLIKKMFVGLLTRIVSTTNQTKYVSLSSQKSTNQSIFINLHPYEYTQGLHYYPFAVNLDRCVGSCNTLQDLSTKVCIPNKAEDLNLSVFNTITEINESKTLTKHVSWKRKLALMVESVIQIINRIMTNVDASAKNITHVKKIIFGILLQVPAKMVNI